MVRNKSSLTKTPRWMCIQTPGYDDFFDKFNLTLERIWRSRKNVIITGDFDANLLLNSDAYGKKLRQIMNYYSYTNLIKKPSRTTETTNIVLDLILVNNLSKVKFANVMDFAIADHKFIYAVYDLIPKKQNPLILKFQSFKREKSCLVRTL